MGGNHCGTRVLLLGLVLALTVSGSAIAESSALSRKAKSDQPKFSRRSELVLDVCPGGRRIVSLIARGGHEMVVVRATNGREIFRQSGLTTDPTATFVGHCVDVLGERAFVAITQGQHPTLVTTIVRIRKSSTSVLYRGDAVSVYFDRSVAFAMETWRGNSIREISLMRGSSSGDITPPGWIDVTAAGARPNDGLDDTDSIRRAVDLISPSGGIVFFPQGEYIASPVVLGSDVTLVGSERAVIRHPDGVTSSNVFESATHAVAAATVAGKRTISVSDTSSIRRGTVVGIAAAGGPSRVQTHELAESIRANDVTIELTDVSGLPTSNSTFMYLQNEVISYDSIEGRTLQGVSRGRLGTLARPHKSGTILAGATAYVGEVTRVSGKEVSVRTPIHQTIRGADMIVGSRRVGLVGLTIDGSRQTQAPSPGNPYPIKMRFSRWATVRDVAFPSGDHGGLSLADGTRDSQVISNTFLDQGWPQQDLGSAIWLFRRVRRSRIVGNTVGGDTFHGITLDDRTQTFSGWDGASGGNLIMSNALTSTAAGSGNSGIMVAGSGGNIILGNSVSGVTSGIGIVESQGTYPAGAQHNMVGTNRVRATTSCLRVSSSNNYFRNNMLEHCDYSVFDTGIGNIFKNNQVL